MYFFKLNQQIMFYHVRCKKLLCFHRVPITVHSASVLLIPKKAIKMHTFTRRTQFAKQTNTKNDLNINSG